VIWFAPFQGLGDEDLIPRSSRTASAPALDDARDEIADDDHSRRSSASAKTTA
jgi:hypothetical protein